VYCSSYIFRKFCRYPTKDWKLVGEFTTKEERSIQTFTLTNAEDYFAKFVRVELTQHYGNEHFCPLTIFRYANVIFRTCNILRHFIYTLKLCIIDVFKIFLAHLSQSDRVSFCDRFSSVVCPSVVRP
jgi:hypothetical protein